MTTLTKTTPTLHLRLQSPPSTETVVSLLAEIERSPWAASTISLDEWKHVWERVQYDEEQAPYALAVLIFRLKSAHLTSWGDRALRLLRPLLPQDETLQSFLDECSRGLRAKQELKAACEHEDRVYEALNLQSHEQHERAQSNLTEAARTIQQTALATLNSLRVNRAALHTQLAAFEAELLGLTGALREQTTDHRNAAAALQISREKLQRLIDEVGSLL